MNRKNLCLFFLSGGIIAPAVLELLNALFELGLSQRVLMITMSLCFIGIGGVLFCMAQNQGDILANQEAIKKATNAE